MLGLGRDLSSPCNGRLRLKVSRGFQPNLQPSASRTLSISPPNPAIKSLGYSHLVRFAGAKHCRFWAKPFRNSVIVHRSFGNARDSERIDNVQYASRYRARLLIKTTSLVKVPLAYASHLPSGDQPNEKIGLGLQCVNCLGAPPSSG